MKAARLQLHWIWISATTSFCTRSDGLSLDWRKYEMKYYRCVRWMVFNLQKSICADARTRTHQLRLIQSSDMSINVMLFDMANSDAKWFLEKNVYILLFGSINDIWGCISISNVIQYRLVLIVAIELLSSDHVRHGISIEFNWMWMFHNVIHIEWQRETKVSIALNSPFIALHEMNWR